MAVIADSCTPAAERCIPGVFLAPVCYEVNDGPTLNGFQQLTRNADCTTANVQVLDDLMQVVPGAVIVSCPEEGECCDPLALCSLLQELGTQVPGVADTALFVTPAGCFLGVPGGGGGGFPGYGTPVTVTGGGNFPGVSGLVARADHIHRLAMTAQLDGAGIGSRPIFNFINGASVDNVAAADSGGFDRVDVTITAQQVLAVFQNAGLIATNPDELHFEDGLLATVTSPTVHVNLDYGVSPASSVDAAAPAAGAATSVLRSDAKLQAATAAPVSTAQANSAGVAATLARSDHVHRTIVRFFDEGVLTSSRPSVNFIGAAVTVVDNPGLDRADVTITMPAVVISVEENSVVVSAAVTTLNFRDGVIASGGPATVDIDVAYGGAPPATAVASAAGAALTLSRSDHTHRTELIVQDSGATISTRPRINFIDGLGITVTVADDVPGDRANITVAGVVSAFAIPSVAADAAAATAGVATTAIRSDAKLSVATGVPVTVTGTTNSAGVATTLARSDHAHRLGLEILDTAVLVATRPRINFIDGLGITVTVADNAGGERGDVTIAGVVSAFATPTVAADAAAATGGAATTAIRSDAKLEVATGTPVAVNGTTNSAGVATTLARSDHIHRLEVQVQDEGVLTASRPRLNFIGAGVGVTDNAGSDRADVTIVGTTFAIPSVAADAAAATAGVATTAIRSDAKLSVATGTPVAVNGTTNSAGVATTLVRSDHVHRLEVQVQEEGVLTASRPRLNFIGTTVTVTDNAGADRADITITNPVAGLVFSRGATVLTPSAAINVIVWRAPFACTVTNVRGYRVGGTGATINARLNGVSNHLAAAVSLAAADTWVDGGAVANTAYVAGDKLEVMLVTLTGSPTQVAVQIDFTRT